MAAPEGRLSASQVTVYLEKGTPVESPSYATLSGGLTNGSDHLVKDPTALTGIGETASTESIPILGKEAAIRISGTPESEEIVLTVLFDASDDLHADIAPGGASTNTAYNFALVFTDSSDVQILYIPVTLAGRRFVTPARGSVTLEVTLAPADPGQVFVSA